MKRQLGLLVLMAVLVVGLANAACTCDVVQSTTTVGTSSTYIRSTQVINATIACTDANATVENATAGVLTASPGTITGALSFNITAGQGNQTKMNFTVNTLALVDTVQQTFSISIKNDTTQQTLATCTETFYSDNTKPTCAHSASSKTDYKPDRTWTATGINASSATLQFGSQPAFTMSEASDVFTYTTTRSSLPEGTYSAIQLITNDGLNTTTCKLDYVTIDSRARAQQIVISSALSGQKQAEAESIVVTQTPNNSKAIGIVALIAVVGFWLIKRKK